MADFNNSYCYPKDLECPIAKIAISKAVPFEF